MERRQFVAGAGATTAIAMAGCSGILGGGGGGDSPEGVVEDIYDAINDEDGDAFESLLHSESPERPVEESDFNQGQSQGSLEVNVQSTEVSNDGPGEDAVRSEFEGRAGYNEEEVNTMVDITSNADDAALVEAEVEITVEYQGQEQTETTTNVHLTATEDGGWTLVA